MSHKFSIERKIFLSFIFVYRSIDVDDTMWSEDNSDEEQNPGPMHGQITEKNPNYEKKDKCKCKKGCSKRSCSCFKFGKGCNETCGCKTTCTNMFNHLDYFFGQNQKCLADPCFTNWIMKTIKNTDELLKIDRQELYEKILKSPWFVCDIIH